MYHQEHPESLAFTERSFGSQTLPKYDPYLRPVLDEILEPAEPVSIVLKYLDTDLLQESRRHRLSRLYIKRVARVILSALKVLHMDGLVHTDVKLDNIFANYGPQNQSRFADIQLGDLGGVVHQDSEFAKEGHLIGTSISRSPEATLQLHWGNATDVWSFGNAVSRVFLIPKDIDPTRNDIRGSNDANEQILSLLYGGDYHLFNPAIEGLTPDDDDYFFTVLKRMYKFFGPFPPNFCGNADTMTIINFFNNSGPPEKPFHLATTREIPTADKAFILKVYEAGPSRKADGRGALGGRMVHRRVRGYANTAVRWFIGNILPLAKFL